MSGFPQSVIPTEGESRAVTRALKRAAAGDLFGGARKLADLVPKS